MKFCIFAFTVLACLALFSEAQLGHGVFPPRPAPRPMCNPCQVNLRTITGSSRETAQWQTSGVQDSRSPCGHGLQLRCTTNTNTAKIVYFDVNGNRIGTDSSAKSSATKQLICQSNGHYIRPNGNDVVASAWCCTNNC